MKQCSQTPKVNPAKRDAYVSERVDDVRKAVQNVQDGKAEYEVMKATDGK